jgi:hypothetical protein
MADSKIMNVMSLLGTAIDDEINKVKDQAEESKKKMEIEVQSVIDQGKNRLALMDNQFNEKFNTQDKKLDEKIANFNKAVIQPVEAKIATAQAQIATQEVKQNGLDSNIKDLTNRVNKSDETFKAIGLVLTKKP